ncbi:MAG: NAD(P)H-hydrate dehydratase [Eubacteriales bacterium]
MKIVTGSQMKIIEEFAFDNLGFKCGDLIKKAAKAVYLEVEKKLLSLEKPMAMAFVAIICGKGNNGQDGIALSKLLFERGIPCKAYTIEEIEKLAKPEILSKIREDIARADIVVDGIFGTGLSRDIKGLPLMLIEFINEFSRYTISIDIPSGISSENGEIMGEAVRANQTVSFQCPKLGCFIFPGAENTGRLSVYDIGLPKDLIDSNSETYFYIDEKFAQTVLHKRKRQSHKGDYGKVLVIAGSKGMAGAAALCALAALRSGAGLVRISCKDDILDIVQELVPEATCISRTNASMSCNDYDSIIIGPGLGINDENKALVMGIIEEYNGNLVLDADALTMIKDDISNLKKSKAKIVITPHEGEAARLLGKNAEDIKNNRIQSCGELVEKTGATVILKGSVTLIGGPHGKISFSNIGNPGMATGGSGDVLSGVVSSFAAQGIPFESVAEVSVYIHGMAGDIMAEIYGEYGMISSDLPVGVAKAIKKIVS